MGLDARARLPLPSSSPIESRPTRGSCDAQHAGREGRAHVRELVQLLGARIGVAPKSSTTIGPSHDGSGCTIAGRSTPGRRRSSSSAGGQHGAGRPGRDGAPGARPRARGAARARREESSRSRAARAGSSSCAITCGRVHDLDLRRRRRTSGSSSDARGRTASTRRSPVRDRVDAHPRRSRVGAPVAAHRVERDGDRGVHAPSGSISRPLYVLHVGHMWCGRRRRPALRADDRPGSAAGTPWWRRLSRRDFEVFFFGNGHTARKRSGRAASRRATTARAAPPSGRPRAARSRTSTRLRSAPHCGQRPAQSSRQRITSGSARISASCAQRSTSSSSPSGTGVVSSSPTSGASAWYSRAVDRDVERAPRSRQRWHGPTIGDVEGEVEEQPARRAASRPSLRLDLRRARRGTPARRP